MRVAVLGAAALVLAGGVLAGSSASAAGPAGPMRKGGLWIATITSGPLASGAKVESCVAPGSAADDSMFAANRGRGGCTTPPTIAAIPGGAMMHLVCSPAAGMTMDTTATATGDFQRRYTVKTVTQVHSTNANMPAIAPITVTVDAVWSGACPADLHPGDTRMGGKIYHTQPH